MKYKPCILSKLGHEDLTSVLAWGSLELCASCSLLDHTVLCNFEGTVLMARQSG